MNPITWSKEQWKDALLGVEIAILIIAEALVVITLFY